MNNCISTPIAKNGAQYSCAGRRWEVVACGRRKVVTHVKVGVGAARSSGKALNLAREIVDRMGPRVRCQHLQTTRQSPLKFQLHSIVVRGRVRSKNYGNKGE